MSNGRTRVRARLAALAVAVVLAGGVAQAAEAAFRPIGPQRSADGGITYSGLLRALQHGEIRSAPLDDGAHVATVAFADGQRARVRYPGADAALPMRMAQRGVDVSVAQQ